MGKALLLVGRPGAGKTTLLCRIVKLLPYRAGGFFTQEIRSRNRRVGFQITDLGGWKGLLAHVDIPGRIRVGKYGVDVESLDHIGTRAIQEAVFEADYVVIDEVGRMEMLSPKFRTAVEEALASEKVVFATIMSRPHPWLDRIKRWPGAVLFEVDRENRDTLVDCIAELLNEWLRLEDDRP